MNPPYNQARMAQTDLLLNVWREACRHLELAESVERIALLLADHVPADYLVVRQIDLTRGGLETVAVGRCRLGRRALRVVPHGVQWRRDENPARVVPRHDRC